MIKYEVKNRFTGAVQFVASIDCKKADLERDKLRAAALWAIAKGADLSGADLSGADLRGADLRGADLSGADLSGADLSGADLSGADLRGAYLRGNAPIEGEPQRPTDQIQGLRGRAYRSDGYEFAIFRMGDDGLVIRAGCRTFTPGEFEAHIVANYNDHPKAVETRRIIAFLIEQSNAEAW